MLFFLTSPFSRFIISYSFLSFTSYNPFLISSSSSSFFSFSVLPRPSLSLSFLFTYLTTYSLLPSLNPLTPSLSFTLPPPFLSSYLYSSLLFHSLLFSPLFLSLSQSLSSFLLHSLSLFPLPCYSSIFSGTLFNMFLIFSASPQVKC